jgi:AcrR family transcriptional regulator
MHPADPPHPPPLRADARRNRDRILTAARDAFAEFGLAVPLDEIATRAGVGPGTVYRHFATKEVLFQAVVMTRVTDLVAEAQRGATDDDPGATFFSFLDRLGAEGVAKADTSDAITVPGLLRDELHEALAVLLARAQAAGAVRADLTEGDIIALFKALFAARDDSDPARAGRLFTILIDGLRPPIRG